MSEIESKVTWAFRAVSAGAGAFAIFTGADLMVLSSLALVRSP